MSPAPTGAGNGDDMPPCPADLPHPVLTENAQTVLRSRYLRPVGGPGSRDRHDGGPGDRHGDSRDNVHDNVTGDSRDESRDDNRGDGDVHGNGGADAERLERPRDLFWRVAWAVARAEVAYGEDPMPWARRFYGLMATLRFLPASPTLFNAGTERGQLAACFVLPVEPGPDGVLATLRHALEVHRTGGGTGFDLSTLPAASGDNDGPLAALRLLDAATQEVKQSGVRRGANMGVLRVDHPDIEAFVDAKRDVARLANFNLSVAVTDDFLDAVKRGADYDLVDPETGASAGTRNARALWRRIAECAWATGEPGLVFIDRMNDQNAMHKIETIGATNPCGEQGLAAYDACNLGSVDLARHVRHGPDGDAPHLDEEDLDTSVRLAVRFLDDVIDVSVAPLERIVEKTRANRRIGLGVMGLGRALYKLQIPYGSAEALEFVDQVMGRIRRVAHDESQQLAGQRGVFPAWADSTWADLDRPMRNAAVTTVAPTGTIGMIADTSGGCEPEFSLVYTKHCLDGTRLAYVVPEFVTVAKREGFWHEGLLDELRANGGSAQGLESVPESWQRVFVTAYDLTPEAHVRMQAACQRHVDNAVSKTINLPRDSRPEDVEAAFQFAHSQGCKGVTVYRDGSRPDQVLRTRADHEPPSDRSATPRPSCRVCVPPAEASSSAGNGSPAHFDHDGSARVEQDDGSGRPAPAPPTGPPDQGHARRGTRIRPGPRPRPPVLRAVTHRVESGCGTVYVTIGEDETGPMELIAVRARGNACTSAHLEATSRMASLALRSGVPLEAVARALTGVRCGEPRVTSGGVVLGCVDAIGQALERQALGPLGPQHEVFQQAHLSSFAPHEEPRMSGWTPSGGGAPTAND